MRLNIVDVWCLHHLHQILVWLRLLRHLLNMHELHAVSHGVLLLVLPLPIVIGHGEIGWQLTLVHCHSHRCLQVDILVAFRDAVAHSVAFTSIGLLLLRFLLIDSGSCRLLDRFGRLILLCLSYGLFDNRRSCLVMDL